ncbi:excalibur calcium-binding domain-containing protein [Mycolicibacillus trivialis]
MIRASFVAACLVVAGLGLSPSASAAGPPYKNCAAAHADGASNMTPDHPGYRSGLDRDGDGIACER